MIKILEKEGEQMKRIFKILLGVFSICLFTTAAMAGSYKLHYKMAPGQAWVATISTEKKSVSTETKDVSKVNTTIEYKVSNGPEKDWISLTARIKSQDHPSGNKDTMKIDLSKIEYVADMHRSGKINNVKYSGNVFPPLDDNIKKQAPKRAAKYKQSSQMIAEIWKDMVFWFPELPENALKPGDEFEFTKEMDIGNEANGINMQGITKQVFTLKEVKDGLAFFMVKGHTTSMTTKAKLGKSGATTEGEGEAVFSLREGMWSDVTLKSQVQAHISRMHNKGERSEDLYQMSKIHMEKQ